MKWFKKIKESCIKRKIRYIVNGIYNDERWNEHYLKFKCETSFVGVATAHRNRKKYRKESERITKKAFGLFLYVKMKFRNDTELNKIVEYLLWDFGIDCIKSISKAIELRMTQGF
jgi:hypothetical protein